MTFAYKLEQCFSGHTPVMVHYGEGYYVICSEDEDGGSTCIGGPLMDTKRDAAREWNRIVLAREMEVMLMASLGALDILCDDVTPGPLTEYGEATVRRVHVGIRTLLARISSERGES